MPTYTRKRRIHHLAVAVFSTEKVQGEVVVRDKGPNRVSLTAKFTKLPGGDHGFHIHRAGDLRGEGCQGLCEHYHTGTQTNHGDEPGASKRPRHTGDLGNIKMPDSGTFEKTWSISGTNVRDLWGRSVIVHADRDDLGLGDYEDSKTTGHSGARIACAIFGRASEKC
jgi:superoxide dismutase, Cu-Zn family